MVGSMVVMSIRFGILGICCNYIFGRSDAKILERIRSFH